MNVYIDSSVVLRVVFGERGLLRNWRQIDRPMSSELVRLECRRTIDRARIRQRLADEDVALHRSDVMALLDAFELVRIDSHVLERAANPFPTLLGSLDSIHLATALLLREEVSDLRFATHDNELATAARATGFEVLGAGPVRAGRR